MLRIAGRKGVVLPLGDFPHDEFFACPIIGAAPPAGDGFATTTFSTIGAVAEVFTWSEAPASFDTPGTTEGIVPVVTFNGFDEKAVAPDADFWSPGNGSSDEAFTIAMWVDVVDTAALREMMTRYDNTSGSPKREWEFQINGADRFALRARDESAGTTIDRVSDNPINQGVWAFLVATYDRTGGATAMDGVVLYQDGVPIASTANNGSGNYAAMENSTSPTGLGHSWNSAGNPQGLFNGKMAGGPLGPLFVRRELTALEVSSCMTWVLKHSGWVRNRDATRGPHPYEGFLILTEPATGQCGLPFRTTSSARNSSLMSSQGLILSMYRLS